jgi:hypothetical protein
MARIFFNYFAKPEIFPRQALLTSAVTAVVVNGQKNGLFYAI